MPPVLTALSGWLDTQTGIWLMTAGMAQRGYDLSPRGYDQRGERAAST